MSTFLTNSNSKDQYYLFTMNATKYIEENYVCRKQYVYQTFKKIFRIRSSSFSEQNEMYHHFDVQPYTTQTTRRCPEYLNGFVLFGNKNLLPALLPLQNVKLGQCVK